MLMISGSLASAAAHCSRPGAMAPHQLSQVSSLASSSCCCHLPASRRQSQWRHTQRTQAMPSCRTRHLRCRAESEGQEPAESSSTVNSADRIKSTLSGLDAMLGIDPEEERRKKEKVPLRPLPCQALHPLPAPAPASAYPRLAATRNATPYIPHAVTWARVQSASLAPCPQTRAAPPSLAPAAEAPLLGPPHARPHRALPHRRRTSLSRARRCQWRRECWSSLRRRRRPASRTAALTARRKPRSPKPWCAAFRVLLFYPKGLDTHGIAAARGTRNAISTSARDERMLRSARLSRCRMQ